MFKRDTLLKFFQVLFWSTFLKGYELKKNINREYLFMYVH